MSIISGDAPYWEYKKEAKKYCRGCGRLLSMCECSKTTGGTQNG